ncbi:MAG: PqqD family protein, partial [Longimicrobiales bacterium]
MNRSGYRPAPDVIATDLGHELILLDPGSGQMYGLNETGRLVWLTLPSRSVENIAATIAARFNV